MLTVSYIVILRCPKLFESIIELTLKSSSKRLGTMTLLAPNILKPAKLQNFTDFTKFVIPCSIKNGRKVRQSSKHTRKVERRWVRLPLSWLKNTPALPNPKQPYFLTDGFGQSHDLFCPGGGHSDGGVHAKISSSPREKDHCLFLCPFVGVPLNHKRQDRKAWRSQWLVLECVNSSSSKQNADEKYEKMPVSSPAYMLHLYCTCSSVGDSPRIKQSFYSGML